MGAMTNPRKVVQWHHHCVPTMRTNSNVRLSTVVLLCCRATTMYINKQAKFEGDFLLERACAQLIGLSLPSKTGTVYSVRIVLNLFAKYTHSSTVGTITPFISNIKYNLS